MFHSESSPRRSESSLFRKGRNRFLFLDESFFAAGIILHVMLHWQWIVSTIQTRLLHQKATKDDGSHTMIGVIILFVFIHLVAGGILWARWAIIELPH